MSEVKGAVGGGEKQCCWNLQCFIPFGFIKPISRRAELREEARRLGGHNNGASEGRGKKSKLGSTSQAAN